MSDITLITGGCRSGKSRHAQELAEDCGKKRLYIATAPVLDEEMSLRVAKHRDMRAGRGWDTLEEETDLAGALTRAEGYDVVLCDCLTLWVNNLLYAASQEGTLPTEEEITKATRAVCNTARSSSAKVFFVTNEVGMGIVPESPLSRSFRDLSGRCNQEIAAAAKAVILMVCGIPLHIKE